VKLKMAQNSLFAILLRSPWWISFIIAAVVGLFAASVLPAKYAVYALFAGGPFVVVGSIAAWRQLRAPSAASIAAMQQAAGGISWRDFSVLMEQAFRRDGYEVTRVGSPAADLEIRKAGRTALVNCKRWKAASHGIEPLRELQAACATREAHESVYVAVGELTDNARHFANQNRIRVLQGAELAQLLRGILPSKK
jgi:restriction system protein